MSYGADPMRHINVKLPKLVIDKYYRDFSQWQHFCRQYEMAVHNNPNRTKPDKFGYLRSYLTSTTANFVAGFPSTEG